MADLPNPTDVAQRALDALPGLLSTAAATFAAVPPELQGTRVADLITGSLPEARALMSDLFPTAPAPAVGPASSLGTTIDLLQKVVSTIVLATPAEKAGRRTALVTHGAALSRRLALLRAGQLLVTTGHDTSLEFPLLLPPAAPAALAYACSPTAFTPRPAGA